MLIVRFKASRRQDNIVCSCISWEFWNGCRGPQEQHPRGRSHSACVLKMTCFYGHPRGHINARACIANTAPVSHRLLLNWYTTHCWLTGCDFVSHSLRSWPIFRPRNTGWIVVWSLKLRSFNCVLTMLAESRSLKGMTTGVTSFSANLPEACDGCWSVTLELIKGTNGGVDKVVRVVQTWE